MKGVVELVAKGGARRARAAIDPELLALDAAVTDWNAALLDAADDLRAASSSCDEVLRRQAC